MKLVVVICLTLCLAACGTAGGLISGAGSDLQRAGDWIKSR